jgi:hypothetical protein
MSCHPFDKLRTGLSERSERRISLESWLAMIPWRFFTPLRFVQNDMPNYRILSLSKLTETIYLLPDILIHHPNETDLSKVLFSCIGSGAGRE